MMKSESMSDHRDPKTVTSMAEGSVNNVHPLRIMVQGKKVDVLAESPDHTLLCCAEGSTVKLMNHFFEPCCECKAPAPVVAAAFSASHYDVFLRTPDSLLVFGLGTRVLDALEQKEAARMDLPEEAWQAPRPGQSDQGSMLPPWLVHCDAKQDEKETGGPRKAVAAACNVFLQAYGTSNGFSIFVG